MASGNAKFWDVVWSRPYGRYNRHHQEIWDAMLPYLKGNIADLGCGACVMYERKQVSLVGIDWSEEALKEARKHYPCGVYILADVLNTGLPSHQFDTVIALGLLDYFENWMPVIDEMKRLVKLDGKIFATLLHTFNGHDWSSIDKVTEKLGYTPKNYTHPCGMWRLIEIC